jgi:hypothetical protein
MHRARFGKDAAHRRRPVQLDRGSVDIDTVMMPLADDDVDYNRGGDVAGPTGPLDDQGLSIPLSLLRANNKKTAQKTKKGQGEHTRSIARTIKVSGCLLPRVRALCEKTVRRSALASS